MTRIRRRRLAAIGTAVLVGCLALTSWLVVRSRQEAAAASVSAVLMRPHPASPAAGTPAASTRATGGAQAPARTAVTTSMPLGACEARLESRPRRRPTVAIVGASYTAGTGPGNPSLSWAVQLARQLHWNAVVYGVPGAGYVRTGNGARGPMDRMLSAEGLHGLSPALVLIQAGFDDTGVPSKLEEQRVGSAVRQIRAAAPHAKIGLLTTFGVTPQGTAALHRTDRAIIAGARAADSGVIIMDPLAGRWVYPRAGGYGLHPTAGGDAWIARTVAGALAGHGVHPAQAATSALSVCDVSVGVTRPPARARRASTTA